MDLYVNPVNVDPIVVDRVQCRVSVAGAWIYRFAPGARDKREKAGGESGDHHYSSGRNMILTPDSSAQDTLAVSPASETLVSSLSSHGPRAPSTVVPRVSTQGMSSPYHVVQLAAHRLSPNMPTMDSTVSSAKPEPELNIGTIPDFTCCPSRRSTLTRRRRRK